MIEPDKPVTFALKKSQHPAFPLECDEDVMREGYYVLRYRHLGADGSSVQKPRLGTSAKKGERVEPASTSSAALSTTQVAGSTDVKPVSIPATDEQLVHRIKSWKISDESEPRTRLTHVKPALPEIRASGTPQKAEAIRAASPAPAGNIIVDISGPTKRTGAHPGDVPTASDPKDPQSRSTPSKEEPSPTVNAVAVVPIFFEHAIRGRLDKVRWYSSHGPPLDDVPVPPSLAQCGDIYVHRTGRDVRMWLRIEPSEWQAVDEGHTHPRLDGYVLRLLDNAEPRWVTQETWRTYVGRWKKSLRDKGVTSS